MCLIGQKFFVSQFCLARVSAPARSERGIAHGKPTRLSCRSVFFYCGSPQYNLKLSFVRDSVTWLVLLREPHCCLCSGRLLVPPHAHRLAVAMRMRSVIGVSFTIAPNHLQDSHRSDSSHLCETSTGRQSCFDLAPVHNSYGLSIRRPKQGLSFVFIRVRKRKRSPVRIPRGGGATA